MKNYVVTRNRTVHMRTDELPPKGWAIRLLTQVTDADWEVGDFMSIWDERTTVIDCQFSALPESKTVFAKEDDALKIQKALCEGVGVKTEVIQVGDNYYHLHSQPNTP